MSRERSHPEPIVITGIGLIASVGGDRESVWDAVRNGHSAMRRLTGLPGIPDNLFIGAPVDIRLSAPDELKVLALCDRIADESLDDARIEPGLIRPERFGCAISAHMGDSRWSADQLGLGHLYPPPTILWT